MLALAFLVCIFFATRKAKLLEIPANYIIDIITYMLIAGILGARILYVSMNIHYYLKHPIEIIMIQKGGLSYFGGFLASLLTCYCILKKRKLKIFKISDLLILYLPLGHAIARIGCFLNGCCYGKQTDIFWAIQYNTVKKYGVHPVQLYSSLANLCIFIILNLRKKRYDGELVLNYIILYGISRFFIEFFRGDHAKIIYGLNTFQLISLLLIIIGIVFHTKIKRNVRRTI